ncbi:DNA cytosine methyltransferase [Actinomycetota bacterium]|nr:DNA cytosine methyltransferase [Actinomycetota bacterium]
MTFRVVDLFAGIGGFHLATTGLGGETIFASELDAHAQDIYSLNFGSDLNGEIVGDIIPLTEPKVDSIIPDHDVLVGGFPCQPFSKSGFQRGLNETRGTLFYNIVKILEKRRPRVVMLENVRNLIGPNHQHTWQLIRRTLRDLGYRTPDEPTIFSPHLLPPSLLGTPQMRERVFIVGVYVGRDAAWANTDDPRLAPNKPVSDWDPLEWKLDSEILENENEISDIEKYALKKSEIELLDMWQDFVEITGKESGNRLPGHPIWLNSFKVKPTLDDNFPDWKIDFIKKNSAFYRGHKPKILEWRKQHGTLLKALPESRRKLEWQAQDLSSLWEGLIQFRPSGVRIKKANYVPALVAMNQTSVVGARKRRLTVREGARLQGFPEDFTFEHQNDSKSFKQLGNAVSVGAVAQVLSQAAYLWDFFPQDISAIIRQSRVSQGLPDEPMQFKGVNEGLW